MVKTLGGSKAFTPAFALLALMLTAGFIPAQGNIENVSSSSVTVQVPLYESSASGGVLRG